MTKQEFMQQIERLRNHWGTQAYQGETLKILWEALGHIEADKLHQAISRVISTYLNKNYPAGLDKLETALQDLKVGTGTNTKVPSRFNRNAGYKPTENGVSDKTANKKLGDILSSLLES